MGGTKPQTPNTAESINITFFLLVLLIPLVLLLQLPLVVLLVHLLLPNAAGLDHVVAPLLVLHQLFRYLVVLLHQHLVVSLQRRRQLLLCRCQFFLKLGKLAVFLLELSEFALELSFLGGISLSLLVFVSVQLGSLVPKYFKTSPLALGKFMEILNLCLEQEFLGNEGLLNFHFVLEIALIDVAVLAKIANPDKFVGLVAPLLPDVAAADRVVAEHAALGDAYHSLPF